MREDAERYYATHWGMTTLWLGLLLPPAAWLSHLTLSFTLATQLCDGRFGWVLHVVSLLAIGVAVAGGLVALRNWHGTGDDTNPDEGGTLARSKFLAIAGMASAVFFTTALIAAEIPNWMLGPCEY